MRTPIYIAQGHTVFFAGMATIFVASSIGQKATEDAMFGVENRQMLVGDHFHLITAQALGELRHLGGV